MGVASDIILDVRRRLRQLSEIQARIVRADVVIAHRIKRSRAMVTASRALLSQVELLPSDTGHPGYPGASPAGRNVLLFEKRNTAARRFANDGTQSA